MKRERRKSSRHVPKRLAYHCLSLLLLVAMGCVERSGVYTSSLDEMAVGSELPTYFHRNVDGPNLGLCGDSSCNGSSRATMTIVSAASDNPEVIEVTDVADEKELWLNARSVGVATIEVELDGAATYVYEVGAHEPDDHDFSLTGRPPFSPGTDVRIESTVWSGGVKLRAGHRKDPTQPVFWVTEAYLRVEPPFAGVVEGATLTVHDDLELVSEVTGERLPVEVER